MEIEILLPKLGESIHHATIVQWLKKEGESIAKDEALVEVATDKVNSEIPSTVKGFVKKILVEVGKEVEVGLPIAIIETDADSLVFSGKEDRGEKKEERISDSHFFSPAVIKLLKENEISLEEAKKIPKKNFEDRLTKRDVEVYLESRNENFEKSIVLDPMRKRIAENMLLSCKEIPSASLITKVDVTPLVEWMDLHKEKLSKEKGVKISITAFAIRALVEALQEFPLVNATLTGEKILFHPDIHIGIAVSVEGGLVVPVLRNCQQKSLFECAAELQELAAKARSKKLSLDQMSEGTITLTNFGMTGIQMGFPIIRYPEVAILGMGSIHKELMVLPDDTTAICSVLYLSLSFDHRLFDGIYACNFLRKVQLYLEENPSEE
jgi:2-oxoglutarate dehydrogenase E2 component (dihydrolipoamide succinyltransferase)